MANNKSAKKRILVAERNRQVNKSYKSTVRTLIKKTMVNCENYKKDPNSTNQELINNSLNEAFSIIDKAVKKKESLKKYPNLSEMILAAEDISPLTFEMYVEHYQNIMNFKYASGLLDEIAENIDAIDNNLRYKEYYGFHPLFTNDDWYDKSKYPNHFIYKFYEELYSEQLRDVNGYGFAIADKAIGDFHGEFHDSVLEFWQREDIQEHLVIVSDYANAKFNKE